MRYKNKKNVMQLDVTLKSLELHWWKQNSGAIIFWYSNHATTYRAFPQTFCTPQDSNIVCEILQDYIHGKHS